MQVTVGSGGGMEVAEEAAWVVSGSGRGRGRPGLEAAGEAVLAGGGVGSRPL